MSRQNSLLGCHPPWVRRLAAASKFFELSRALRLIAYSLRYSNGTFFSAPPLTDGICFRSNYDRLSVCSHQEGPIHC